MDLPEIVFGSSDPSESRRIARLREQGLLRDICPRVYTSNLEDKLPRITRRHLYSIFAHIAPGAVIGYRSASGIGLMDYEAQASYKYHRVIKLPGIDLRLLDRPGALEGDIPLNSEKTLYMASNARRALECLQRGKIPLAWRWTMKEAEIWLGRLHKEQGTQEIQELLAHAQRIAPILGMDESLQLLQSVALRHCKRETRTSPRVSTYPTKSRQLP